MRCMPLQMREARGAGRSADLHLNPRLSRSQLPHQSPRAVLGVQARGGGCAGVPWIEVQVRARVDAHGGSTPCGPCAPQRLDHGHGAHARLPWLGAITTHTILPMRIQSRPCTAHARTRPMRTNALVRTRLIAHTPMCPARTSIIEDLACCFASVMHPPMQHTHACRSPSLAPQILVRRHLPRRCLASHEAIQLTDIVTDAVPTIRQPDEPIDLHMVRASRTSGSGCVWTVVDQPVGLGLRGADQCDRLLVVTSRKNNRPSYGAMLALWVRSGTVVLWAAGQTSRNNEPRGFTVYPPTRRPAHGGARSFFFTQYRRRPAASA
jgi:hypothetical protein